MNRNRMLQYIQTFFLFLLLFLLLFHPKESSALCLEGLQLAFLKVVPSVFPYLVITGILLKSNLYRKIGRILFRLFSFWKIFGEEEWGVLFLGMLGGFPMGSRSVSALYTEGKMAKEDAEKMVAITNFPSPGFLFVAVGEGVFQNPLVGLLFLCCQCAVGFVYGAFLFRKRKAVIGSELLPKQKGAGVFLKSKVFTNSVGEAAIQMLKIIGYVVFFFVVLGIVDLMLPIPKAILPLFRGFFELSSGIALLEDTSLLSLLYAAMLCSFSGWSVHMQVLNFLNDCGLSSKEYFKGKAVLPIFFSLSVLLFAKLFHLLNF